MKLTTSVFSALVALALSAQAATLTVMNVPDNEPVPISNVDGSILASGTVGLGIFDGDVNALIASANPVADLQAAFQQFGNSVAMGSFGVGTPGLYQGEISETVLGSQFSGQNVYTVIGNGSDLQGGSTGLLVVDHGFNFVDEPSFGEEPILTADANAIFGETAQADIGGSTFDGFQLIPIPEPSSAMLGLMGLTFLVRRRRK